MPAAMTTEVVYNKANKIFLATETRRKSFILSSLCLCASVVKAFAGSGKRVAGSGQRP